MLYSTYNDINSRRSLGLLDVRLEFKIPGQISKRKNMKTFFQRLPLSRFLAKPLRVNKICHEKPLKNMSFGVDFKVHNISDVGSRQR